MCTVRIDLCPLQGSFFSQFRTENSKRPGVYLRKKGSTFGDLKFQLDKILNRKQFQTVTKVWKWCFKAGSCHKAIANAFTRTPTFLFATTLDKISSSDRITSTKSPKHQWLSGQGKAMIGQKKTFHNWSDPCGGGWSWVSTRSSARESPRAWTAAVSTWCALAPGTTSASTSTMCSKPTYFRYFYLVLIST